MSLYDEYASKLPAPLLNEVKENIEKRKVSESQLKEILENVYNAYKDAQIHPGEAIGLITAESFGEPSTQMSIAKNEKVIVKVNNRIKIIEIGKFIDNLIDVMGSFKINKHSEVLPLNSFDVSVPSINNEEKIEWKKVAEVSRHKSPNKLMKLITASGRKIIATDNHSFVTRMNNKIIPILGKKLNVGDRIPALRYLPEHCTKAISVCEYVDFPDKNDFRATRAINPTKIIPSELKLDFNFGWFIGAYLAEGNAGFGQLGISNLDDNYINNARRFITKIGLDYKEIHHHRVFAPSRDFIVNSALLARFVRNICGNGSACKKVPEFAFSAKEEFVTGLLRGYFDGDGNVSVNRKIIRVSSNSEELLDGIKLLLTRFGIFASKSRDHKQHYLIIPYKYAPAFLNKVGSDIDYKRENLKKLSKLAYSNTSKSYKDMTDMISGFGNILVDISKKLGLLTRYVNSATKRQKIGRSALLRHIQRFEAVAEEKDIDISFELNILKRMYNSDVVWDEIVKIEYVEPLQEYVYDFSVPGLETFTTFDGIVTHNTLRTFHFAGVSEMNVTIGLPRLIEIFDAKKIPSTPIMEVYLKQKYTSTIKQIKEIAARLKETTLEDVASEFSLDLIKFTVEVKLNRKTMQELELGSKEVVAAVSDALKGVNVSIDRDTLLLELSTKQYKLSDLYKLKEKSKEIHISGVKEIKQVLPMKNNEEFVIYCEGSNLKDILQKEEVDGSRVKTNNVFEIASVLGIEAARQAIINEASNVIEEQGLSIDIRHIMFLADAMTNSGEIKGVTRSGITGEKESVLARASFETPIKHVVNASLVGERDPLRSVIENVMLNQPVPIGTGLPGLTVKMKPQKGTQ